jgi:hypothetical protein
MTRLSIEVVSDASFDWEVKEVAVPLPPDNIISLPTRLHPQPQFKLSHHGL